MAVHSTERILLVAMELSNSKWKLLLSDGSKKSIRTIDARDLLAFDSALEKTRDKFKLPDDCRVVCGYEAGRDGFWIHRHLVGKGLECIVMDPASIEVRRGGKNKKTDRIDVEKLHEILERKVVFGQDRAFSEVVVPSEEIEAEMRTCRERDVLKKERGQHRMRIQSLCVGQGITTSKALVVPPSELRNWKGEALPAELISAIEREQARLRLVDEQIRELERYQRTAVKEKSNSAAKNAATLIELKSIGIQTAYKLSSEAFWRKFENRKKAGAFTGLTGTPYNSGDSVKDQGISKAGSKKVRVCMIELAWLWLRHQPESALSKWFFENYGAGTKRCRKKGIVALARKLFIALWKYLEHGELPAGAQLKA